MAYSNYNLVKKSLKNEHLQINLHKQRVTGNIHAARFIDNDTRQYVFYLPSLEISSYGDTIEKAKEMLNFSMDEYFKYLMTLSMQDVQTELSKLGWKKGLFNKEYSKADVDGNGELKNLNAKDGKVERLTIEATAA